MAKRTLAGLLTIAAAALGADPVVGNVTLRPTSAPANTPTLVTLSAVIADLSLGTNGANVQRLNEAGTATAVLGIMHDDGANGDAVANDRIFTLTFTLNEMTPGRVFFRATAAFQGVTQRVLSSRVGVDIANAATSLSIDSAVSPTANAAGWLRQDAIITYSCSGGAGGSATCPAMIRVGTEGNAQTFTGLAADGTGAQVSKTNTINLDKSPPVISITSPANGATVALPAITLTGTVTDDLSGVATFTCNAQTAALAGSGFNCNLPLVPGPNNIAVQATDVAGNVATSAVVVNYSVANLTVTSATNPLPNAAGWNNSDVTVSFACAGGVAPVVCPPAVVISNEGGNQSISRTATDSVGTTASASATLRMDKTRPTLVITSPSATASVVAIPQLTVTGNATDQLSGIARVTCNGTQAALVAAAFSCALNLVPGLNQIAIQATDVAGNSTSSDLNITLGMALTISATTSPAPNQAGWNNSNVTVTFTCAGGAGTVTCPPPVTVTNESANQVLSRTATDAGGNSALASITIKIDKTPPTLNVTSPQPGATVVNAQLNITATVGDTLSGVASATCNGSPAPLAQSNLTCSRTLLAGPNTIIIQATDIAGNPASIAIPVTLNTPTLTISATPTPAPNAAGWNNTDVTVAFACAGGNGAISCPTPVVVATEGANQTVSRNVSDSSGNSGTASVTLRIDKTPSALNVASPTPGAVVSAAQLAILGTVGDALSGLASLTCNGVTATPAQTTLCTVTLTPGANTIVLRGTDLAGNLTIVSLPVTYSLAGFTVTTSVVPLPNVAGWNNTNVTVNFACIGGVAPVICPAAVPVATEGANQVIDRTATDSTGAMATGSVTLKIDKAAPNVAITSPASGATFTTVQANIAGTATDGLSGLASVTCNGVIATLTPGAFACTVNLNVGANTITIIATDIAGNTATATRNVTRGSPLTITLSSPANLSYLNISPTTVNGTVSDPSATVTINGLAAAVTGGNFSVQIPLAEGPNVLTATAMGPDGSATTASVQVTLDTTQPHVTITNPADKFVTTEASIVVAGTVNDIVVGTVNDQQASVKVNGATAQVSNRTFLVPSVPLNIGDNIITAVALDRVGNSATTQITVTRQAATLSQIKLISGNLQTGIVGAALPGPLTVAVTDAAGAPLPNKPVIFKITQNNGMVASGGQPATTIIANTNAQGQAQAQWTLGLRAGAGGNTLEAYSVGVGGTAVFTATGNQGTPGKIVVDSGDSQIAAIDQPLPKPLIAVVVDDGNNRLSGVPVTFTVKQGGGSFAGQPTFTVNSDSDGRAAATLTTGNQEGNANNLVEATFPGNTSFPAAFTASGRAPGNPAATTISGVVLDNSNVPIPGITVRAVGTFALTAGPNSVQTAPFTQTDAQGQFKIASAPVGFVKLLVDGSTATLPGTYPSLDYDMVTIAGQNNTLGMPVYLLPLNTNEANRKCVTQTEGGGTLTIPEAPGFSLTFGPGQVTFPGGSKTGCVSVTVVHGDKVPMVPGFGQQPRFIVTIQPAGAIFNPPAPITIPNVDGLKPRATTEMYSFDHDIGSFVAIGTGTVSDDGQVVRSSAGVGVLKAGWHCGGDPDTRGRVANCPVCNYCQGATDASATCIPDPGQRGNSCGDPSNQCFTGGTCGTDTSLDFDRPTGVCVGGTALSSPDARCVGGGTQLGICVGGVCQGSGDQCPATCPTGNCANGQCVTNNCFGLPERAACNAGGNSQGTCQNGQCRGSGDQCSVTCNGGDCVNGVCVNESCTGRRSGALCLSGGRVPGICQNGQCQGSGPQCPSNCNGSPCVNGTCVNDTFGLTPLEISFSNDLTIYKDQIGSTTAITDPVWLSTSGVSRNESIAYVSGQRMRISVRFGVTPAPMHTVSRITIQGDIPGIGKFVRSGLTIPAGATELSVADLDTDAVLPGTTNFFNPLTITWHHMTDGGNCPNCITDGITQHKVYVTLRPPQNTEPLYLTVLHLATAGGATDRPEVALAKSWSYFGSGSGPADVTTWDGRPLIYYPSGLPFSSCSYYLDVILTDPNGASKCGALGTLFAEVLRTNGIDVQNISVDPAMSTPARGMLVKNWRFSASPSFTSSPAPYQDFLWKFTPSAGLNEMVPVPVGSLYGDLQSQPGVPGQHTATPSEKAHINHAIVFSSLTNTYYDPSYGLTYTSADDFEAKALDGYFIHIPGDPQSVNRAKKTQGQHLVTFSPY